MRTLTTLRLAAALITTLGLAGTALAADSPDTIEGSDSQFSAMSNSNSNYDNGDEAEIPSYAKHRHKLGEFGHKKYFWSAIRVGTAVSGRHKHPTYGKEVRADGYANFDLAIMKKELSIVDMHAWAIKRSKTDDKAYASVYILGQQKHYNGFTGPAPKHTVNKSWNRTFAGGCIPVQAWIVTVNLCGSVGGSIGIQATADAGVDKQAKITMGPYATLDGSGSALVTGPLGQLGAGPAVDVRVLGTHIGPTATAWYEVGRTSTTYKYDMKREGCLESLSGTLYLKVKAFFITKNIKLFDWDGFEVCKSWGRNTGSVTRADFDLTSVSL